MDKFEKFNNIFLEFRKQDIEMFDNPFMEKIALESEVNNVENTLNLKLPVEYTFFLKNYSAGNFGYSLIYSVKTDSDYNLININEKYPHIGYLLFSENGCGDFYGFKIENQKCLPSVYFYDHETDTWEATKYVDLLDFLYGDAFSSYTSPEA